MSGHALRLTKHAGGRTFGLEARLGFDPATPFPSSDIRFGAISVGTGDGRDIAFGNGAGEVTFSGSAAAFAGIAVNSDPRRLLENLRPDGEIAPGLRLRETPGHHFVMLRMGYAMSGAIQGGMALFGGGSVNFGADGQRQGAYAVIRRTPVDQPAAEAIRDVVDCWTLPGQIRTADDLAPGTWITTEVDGSVSGSLGIEYGFDFNWLRATQVGDLHGDIGLRLQMGIDAAVGFQASGRYLLSVGRDSEEQKIRVQLFKLKKSGWSFASSFRAQAKADLSRLPPASADDFIKAVFGVHGAQVIRDLRAIEKWADPGTDLAGGLIGLSADQGVKLLGRLTGLDIETAFETAKNRLTEFLDAWESLDEKAATLLWKLVEENVDLGPVREAIDAVANHERMEDAVAALGWKSESVEFLRTPEGRMLETLARQGLLAALGNRQEYRELWQAAKTVQTFLNRGASMEFLERLQSEVEERLNLDQALEIADSDFGDLDEWLKARLSAFLGLEKKLNAKQFREVQGAILGLLEKRQEYYTKSCDALGKEHAARIAQTFQQSTEKTALYDVSFDFSGGLSAAKYLRAAIAGDFSGLEGLVTSKGEGVTLHEAAGSHEIRRMARVEITLPICVRRGMWVTRSLANWKVAEAEAGRVIVYELDATNSVRSEARKMSRDSSLAIAGAWRKQLGGSVRYHGDPQAGYSYSLRQTWRNASKAELLSQLRPYVAKYMPDNFAGEAQPLAVWMDNLDHFLELKESNGIGNIGDTALGLELELAGNVLEPWMRVRAKCGDEYRRMSAAIQASLKEILPRHYFSDPAHWGSRAEVAPLLVYAAMPPRAIGRREMHWNISSKPERRRMANKIQTRRKLASLIAEYGPLAGVRAEDAGDLLREAVEGIASLTRLEVLLRRERRLVQKAWKAGRNLSDFMRERNRKPSQAVKELANAGVKLTEAFNKELESLYGGSEVRAYATWVFLEAARALADDPAALKPPNARLHLAVVRDGSPYKLEAYLDGEPPPVADVLYEDLFQQLAWR